MIQVNAQECKQVCVAKQFYEQGETVIISGKFDVVLEKTPLLIQVYRDTNRVHVAQIDLAQDGSYTYQLVADGPYFKTSGKYLVQVAYGPAGNVYETSFEYHAKDTSGTTQIFEVDAGQFGTFDVPYTIRGGNVTKMFVDQDILGLVVTINSQSNGQIILDLPRQWMDAKKPDGTDDTYIIQIDGLQVPYTETVDADSRLVTINFQKGDSDIEIIGTFVIPEFGSLAVIVFVVASICAILFTKKSYFKFN